MLRPLFEKILADCDPVIRAAFLTPVLSVRVGEQVITSMEDDIISMETWELCEDPTFLAIQWQQMRTAKAALQKPDVVVIRPTGNIV